MDLVNLLPPLIEQTGSSHTENVLNVPFFIKRDDLIQRMDIHLLKESINTHVMSDDMRHVETSVYFSEFKDEQLKTLYSHNSDEIHFAASTNKIPITLLLLEDLQNDKISLNDTIALPETDDRPEGAGIFDQGDDREEATVRQLLVDMLARSGNLAARVLVQEIGGVETINQRLVDDNNLAHTKLGERSGGRFSLGDTTPREAVYSLSKVVANQDSYGKLATTALAENIFDDYGVKAQMDGERQIVLINKMGQLDQSSGTTRHDVGIIHNTKTGNTYGFAIMNTADNEDVAANEQAEMSLAGIGKVLLDYVEQRQARQSALDEQLVRIEGYFGKE